MSTNVYSLQYDVQIEYTSTVPIYSADTGEYEWYVYNMMYRVYLSIYWRPALHVRAVNLPPPPELKCLPEIDYLKILHRCSRGT